MAVQMGQANLASPRTLSKTQMFFSLLYGKHMKLYPKRFQSVSNGEKRFDKDKQWVFIGSKYNMKSVASQSTLFAVLEDPAFDSTYYTPNGYYRRDKRLTENLRWLNGYVFDIDISDEIILDIFDRIHRAGLPMPTAIVETPSGGYHVVYIFDKPVRATVKAIRLYSAIMFYIARELGADLAAVGANRIFRTPTDKNLIYFEPDHCYDFDVFVDWRDINYPYEPENTKPELYISDLMNHPAIQYLLNAPCGYGRRDIVAFNLALAMKASGWSISQAEEALRHWYHNCCEKGAEAGKRPFTERDVIYKVSYVYRKSNYIAPKAAIIRELTDMPFFYRKKWVGAKPREERVRTHLYEWEEDLMQLLRLEKKLTGTQKELADRLNCPLTSFRAVLRKLSAEGRVLVEAIRGRGGKTIIRLPEDDKSKDNLLEFKPRKDDPHHQQPQDNDKVILIYTDFVSKIVTRKEQLPISEKTRIHNPEPEPPD